ncbi:MAG TPA: PPOX class F420-dependent oxidoreductase [Acidimicrobiales bacterium]|nr:PPOX class F420-dependent oxidoreductase [Acidimicrobiales bacterium]
MSFAERLANRMNRMLDRGRSADAADAATTEPTGSIDDLKGRKYCVLVTYKRDGTPMPTPLWFGVGNGKVYAETGESGKAKRIRNNPKVRVAPSDSRGKPTAPPFLGTARVIDAGENAAADRFIQANYGWYRTAYNKLLTNRVPTVIIEVTPAPRTIG